MCSLLEETSSTSEKILRCACALFAENGYKNTRVQDICSKAEVNIASVNYHFRCKEGLYEQVWGYAAEIASKHGGTIDSTLPAREWLGCVLEQRVRTIFNDGPAGWLPKLIFHEHTDGSHMSPALKKKVVQPIHEAVINKLQAFFGADVSEMQFMTAAALILGTMPAFVHLRHYALKGRVLDESEIDEVVHNTKIYVFAGLDALRAEQAGGE